MQNFNSDHAYKTADQKKVRVLVAPLDWGLGHASRCIPVIYELLRQNIAVFLAGEGAQESLLRQEFPDLPFLPLKGYRVKYARTATGLLWNMVIQTPRLLRTIKEENKWLQKIVQDHHIDAVIADNRFGLYHTTVPSAFITHQLLIKNPLGKWLQKFLQRNNYTYINRFTECWVPDENNDANYAGELSHPVKKPAIPVYYTGILSRLTKKDEEIKKHHLFISLSGPEPQRTLLENKIINDISHYNGTATIVRGLPDTKTIIPSTGDLRFYNHLSVDDFNTEIANAEFVISRSGYSTVMDIVAAGKKSILIPTPGQTEQEYLATYLMQKKVAFCISQKDFSLSQSLQAASQFAYQTIPIEAAHLPGVIENFLKKIK